jgi:glucans biosynthesis protein C
MGPFGGGRQPVFHVLSIRRRPAPSRDICSKRADQFRREDSTIGDTNEQVRSIRTSHGDSRAAIESESATSGLVPAMRGLIDSKGPASSVALNNMRGHVILIVLAFHSLLAYLGSLGPSAFPFDLSPYEWRAFPIVDSHRWFGFDLFCAWQDVYLMTLMFFLSALFTWPSLKRKSTARFLSDRFVRLGVPFAFALIIVMPIALYPVYRVTSVDPSLAAYAQHYLALPFWPNGPMWFLWQLLTLTVMAAALHRYAPHWVETLGRWSSSAGTHPGRYFIGLVVASALAYTPMAIVFTPWTWSEHGPFALQFCRSLHYVVYYLAGLGIGAYGLERGLLASDGMLARRWAVWLGYALASLFLWMGLTGLAMRYTTAVPLLLQVGVGISFALACASGGFFLMGVCLRFGTHRSRIFGSLAHNAFGMYLFHYMFVVWLQYALLGMAWFAITKAIVVYGGTVILAWTMTEAVRLAPFGTLLVGTDRPMFAKAPSSAAGRRTPPDRSRNVSDV